MVYKTNINAAQDYMLGRLSFAPCIFNILLHPAQLKKVNNQAQFAKKTQFSPKELNRAREQIQWLREIGATYFKPETPKTHDIYILDQSHDEISEGEMRALVSTAMQEHPQSRIAIIACENGYANILSDTSAPIKTIDRNVIYNHRAGPFKIYTHTARLGFDALLFGPELMATGSPFYSQDAHLPPSEKKPLELLYAEAMFGQDENSPDLIEALLLELIAKQRASVEDQAGYIASNILLWKRPFLKKYIGQNHLQFSNEPSTIQSQRQKGRTHIHWGLSNEADIRMEDGFLRSKGLGAALVRPLSLVFDKKGLYFDPRQPSELEDLIIKRSHGDGRIERLGQELRQEIIDGGLCKYNIGKEASKRQNTDYILVVGQVEDDASILTATHDINSNLKLLRAAREAHPNRYILYKPHPDVEAGLRKGKISDALKLADEIVENSNPLDLLGEACIELWTMSSLMGFEALIRDVKVVCAGMPFYAGWGLTHDLIPAPMRRNASPTIAQLIYATLIDYPRYFDPQTGKPISITTAMQILQETPNRTSQARLKMLSLIRKARARLLKKA